MSNTPDQHSEATPSQLDALNQRINDIVAFQKKKGPWYSDTSLMISAAAFFISVMTTVVSWYRTYQQDINSLRSQLRASIQQSNTIGYQHFEMATKYGNDAKNFVFASSLLNAQNVLASRQSYSLALALGKSATSVELTGTADSLIKSGEAVPAERLLVLAVERAENSVDYVAALRVLSGLQFQSGRVGEAKASFKRALSVFERYPTDANNQHYFIATGVHTHLFWANAVMWIDCSLARESTLAAGQLASRLPAAAPQIPQMRSEIDRVNGMLANCPP